MSQANSVDAKDVSDRKPQDFYSRYGDILKKSGLAEESGNTIKFTPYACEIYAKIREILNSEFSEMGFFDKRWEVPSLSEKAIKGLSSDLISEDYFCKCVALQTSSFCNLPKLCNRWIENLSAIRPLTKSSNMNGSFLQVGHTLSEGKYGAQDLVQKMFRTYGNFLASYLSVPTIEGKVIKSKTSQFVEYTYGLKTMSKIGEDIDIAVVNHLGNKLCKELDIQFEKEEGELDYPFETSWGIYADVIPALVMVHGDDKGIVLPSDIAPLQVIIIPMRPSNEVLEAVNVIAGKLEKLYRIKVDNEQIPITQKILKYDSIGVPLRIEVTPDDCETDKCTITRRDTGEKIISTIEDIDTAVALYLEKIKNSMYECAFDKISSAVYKICSLDEFEKSPQNHGGYIVTSVCNDPLCTEKIFENTGFIPEFNPITPISGLSKQCVICGRKTRQQVICKRQNCKFANA